MVSISRSPIVQSHSIATSSNRHYMIIATDQVDGNHLPMAEWTWTNLQLNYMIYLLFNNLHQNLLISGSMDTSRCITDNECFTEPQTLVAPCVKAVYELFTFLYLLQICQFKAQLLNNIRLIPFLFVDSAIWKVTGFPLCRAVIMKSSPVYPNMPCCCLWPWMSPEFRESN